METEPVAPEEPSFDLPEDNEVRLSIAFAASGLVLQKQTAAMKYQSREKDKQIQALSHGYRDSDTMFYDRLAAIIRDHGTMDDVPKITKKIRPPDWVTVIAISAVALGVIAYAQYNVGAREWLIAWWNANNYIVVGIVVFFLLVWAAFKLRKRRNRAKV